MFRPLLARLLVFSLLFGLGTSLSCLAQVGVKPEPEVSIEQRIDFYTKKLQQHPTLFVVHTQLAAAYLDKARENLDPKWLKLAEQSLEKSLKIYPSFDGYKGMLALNAYRHRFADARKWGEQAHKTFPDDIEVIALLAEADLGLNEIAEAEKRIQPYSSNPEHFHIFTTQAMILKTKQQWDAAREKFMQAEQIAKVQGYPIAAVWARTNAAGMLIDSGRAKEARADLEAATAMRKGDTILRLHWAEYHEGVGELHKALSIVESMLEDADHPSFHARAYRLSLALGKKDAAKAHFDAAERGYLAPLDAGEIYSLGSLAQLYCDANVHLDKALAYAQRNLEFKRDDEAQEALKCVQDKLAAQRKKPAKRSKPKA